MTKNPISVVIADDQSLFREIARGMFEADGEFEVVAEAVDGIEAIAAYERTKPDLVLIDIQMARMNGLEAARRILESDPNARVVLISMRADPEYERVAREIGVIGFVAKRDLDPSALKSLVAETRAQAA